MQFHLDETSREAEGSPGCQGLGEGRGRLMECSGIQQNSVTILKTTELHILKGGAEWYVNDNKAVILKSPVSAISCLGSPKALLPRGRGPRENRSGLG